MNFRRLCHGQERNSELVPKTNRSYKSDTFQLRISLPYVARVEIKTAVVWEKNVFVKTGKKVDIYKR